MAGVNDGSMQQWLLVKKIVENITDTARSRRRLQGDKASDAKHPFRPILAAHAIPNAEWSVISSFPLLVTRVIISDFYSH